MSKNRARSSLDRRAQGNHYDDASSDSDYDVSKNGYDEEGPFDQEDLDHVVELSPAEIRILPPTCSQKIKEVHSINWFMYICITLICAGITYYIETKDWQREWHILTFYAFVCLMLAIGGGTPRNFFMPVDEETTRKRKAWSFMLLSGTSFVSWVMAKSVQNSSKLGARFGLIGGLAYASWFVGIFTTGVVVYYLRKQGYYSLPDFIHDRYGPLSLVVFLLTVLYRLFNEVWSNTIVIADFFGPSLSTDWKLAAWVSMGIPAAYTLVGGMRTSLVSDFIQAVLMCALLAATYLTITGDLKANDDLRTYARANHGSDLLWRYNPVPDRQMWSLEGGLDLAFTGLVQGALSYTYMDPALTDRAFLSSKEMMVAGFTVGSIIAIAYITIFGFIGVYGSMVAQCVEAGACPSSDLNGADIAAVRAGEPSAVGTVLGSYYYSLLCLVIVTSALSTLDSTFSAVAKAVGPDLAGFLRTGKPLDPLNASFGDVLIGRIAIVAVGIAGTIPLLQDPEELSATTVAGTMVPGLGPPIYMAALACICSKSWSGRSTTKTRPALFLLPFFFSAAIGTCYQLAAQGDKNCAPFKLTECSAPLWTPAAADMCSSFDAYYGCIHESGCFEKSDLDHCTAHEANLGCALQCHEKYTLAEKGYETIVDLSGFSYGKGVYKNLFGVNLLSAFGALCLFIFACGDDYFDKMPESKAKRSSEDPRVEGHEI